MKKMYLCPLLLLFLYSCINNKENKMVEIKPSGNVQHVIDSIINFSQADSLHYEIFVDRTIDYECDIILHISKEPYYSINTLSLFYMLSNNKRVRIYSGIESYFNIPSKEVDFGRTDGIFNNSNHKLWAIHLYKDSIVDVYSASNVNPFTILSSSPNRYLVFPPIKQNND